MPFTVDDEYTESTAEAVMAWQDDIGAAVTGVVARGDVFFVPSGGQVDALHADVSDRNLFEIEAEVTVELPG